MARRFLIGLAILLAGAAPASSRSDVSGNPGQSARKSGALAGAVQGQRLQIDRVPFNIFAEAALRRVSDRPFVLCDAVLNDKRPVSLRLEPHQLTLSVIRQAFAAYGFSLSEKGGVVYGCGSSGAASGPDGVATGVVYAPGGVQVPQAGIGPVERYDVPPPYFGAEIPLGSNIPLGSPLTPPVGLRGPMVAVESELMGYRPDFVSPGALLSAVQPVFPDVKFSVVQGEGQRPALFASGERSEVARFKEMAAYLDRPPEAVEIQAIVLEVTDGSRTGFGVSMVLDAVRHGVGVNVSGGAEANQLTFHSGSFDAVLSAVSGSTNVRVVSSPRLRGRAGEKLRLQVGADVPTLGAVVENPMGSTAQSIQYRSSGVIFEVTPTVLGKRIGLAVHQELSAFAETETGVRGSPTLTTRALDTALDLESGEWAVVGGLSSSEDQVSRQSLLGVVPIGKVRTVRKTELVLLLNVRRVER